MNPKEEINSKKTRSILIIKLLKTKEKKKSKAARGKCYTT